MEEKTPEEKKNVVFAAILELPLTLEEQGQVSNKLNEAHFIEFAFRIIKKGEDLLRFVRSSLGKLIPSPISQKILCLPLYFLDSFPNSNKTYRFFTRMFMGDCTLVQKPTFLIFETKHFFSNLYESL